MTAQIIEQNRINSERNKRMSGVTGASDLASAIRNRVESAKAKIGAANDKVNKAADNLNDIAIKAEEFSEQIDKEAADLQAALGLNTNFPPA